MEALILILIIALIVGFTFWRVKTDPRTPSRQEMQKRERASDPERQRLQQGILKVLESGNIPDITWRNAEGAPPLPFVFQKSEHLVYVFSTVGYAEMKTKREIVGKSAGTSLRIAKGMSVRLGASKGTPVEYDDVVFRGTGTLAVTTKHIYFNGDSRSFRIHFSKIISIEQHDSGICVTRDRASAQPEYFLFEQEEDESFACKLFLMISSLVSESPKTTGELIPPTDYYLHGADTGGDDMLDQE